MPLHLLARDAGSSKTGFVFRTKLRESAMALEGKRVLFISYNGMLDPLGQTQVIPYLRELGRRGVRFTLLSFERQGAFEPAGATRCKALRIQLSEQNIESHGLRYQQRL